MAGKKLLVSKRQILFIAAITIAAGMFAAGWVLENSGLRPAGAENSVLARRIAELCIRTALSAVFFSVGLYIAHLWNKFRGYDYQ